MKYILVIYRKDKSGPAEGARVISESLKQAEVLPIFKSGWRLNFNMLIKNLIYQRQYHWIGFGFLPDVICFFAFFGASRISYLRGDIEENYKVDYGVYYKFISKFHFYICSKLDNVFVLTNALKNKILKNKTGIVPVVVPNFISSKQIEKINPSKNNVPNRIVVVGSLNKRKNSLEAVKISYILKQDYTFDIPVHYYGDGPLRNEIQDYAESLSVSINIHGFDPNYLSQIYSEDIVLHCSFSEGLSRSCMECLARNVRLISRNWAGCNELIRNGENGLIYNNEEGAAKMIFKYFVSGKVRKSFLLKHNELEEGIKKFVCAVKNDKI